MDSKLKGVKPYFYFDKKAKMLLCNNFQGWKQDDKGTTDSLWRTGIAHICYPENHSIKSGLLEAFRLRPDGKFQACRCNPRLGEHDVSRDQVIMSMSALKINSTSPISKIILKKIARGLPYKLSNRYNMTPNLWLWLRGITGNPIADYLNQIYMIIELIISVSLNKFINWQIKPTYCSQNRLEYLLSTVGEEKLRATKLNTKWKKFLWKMEFPGYALHLSAWMVFVSRDGFLKRLLQRIILADADKDNLLIKLLCGEDVTDIQIEDYQPMEEWRWSQRMNEMTRTRIIPQENLDLWELDKRILKVIKQKQVLY